MCYSAQERQAYKDYCNRFGAKMSIHDFVRLLRQREMSHEFDFKLNIPDEMVSGLIDHLGKSAAAKEIELMQRRWKVAEGRRLEGALQDTIAELQQAEAKFNTKATKTNQKAFETKTRKAAKAKAALEHAGNVNRGDYRIYPYYFAPLIVEEDGQRVIVPARYRILPRSGVEVPNSYNVFNSRRDSLTTARNWVPLFGKQHAIFPFENFFEWVERDAKAVEIKFHPEGHDFMHAAALYEVYTHPELGPIRSFSMVTDEPPPEVAAAGHDRCPVFLQHNRIDRWLKPQGQSLQELDELLDHKEQTYYSHALAA